jgi:hypothetical protein
MTMYPLSSNCGGLSVERLGAGVAFGSTIGIIVIIQEARP